MWRNKEYLSSVQKTLNEIGGVCQRCILRFGGVKSSKEHRNITIEDNIVEQENKNLKDIVSMMLISGGWGCARVHQTKSIR